MGLLDSLKNMFGGKKSDGPIDLNSPEEIKAKMENLMQQHGETVNKVADEVQEKIPGEVDDKIIDTVQEKLTGQQNPPQ